MVKWAFLIIFAAWTWPAAGARAASPGERPVPPEVGADEPDTTPDPDEGGGEGEDGKKPPSAEERKLLAEIDRLVGQLAHEFWDTREAAQKRLLEIGKPAAPALRKAATSEDLEVATRAKAILREVVGLGWLGIEIRDALGEDRGEHEVPEDTGAVASRVLEGTPAEKAGILVGDILHTLNGTVIRSSNHLVELVADTEPGTKARLVLFRAGRRKVLEVKIGRRPKEYMPDAAPVPE
jgi:hypothetical protein